MRGSLLGTFFVCLDAGRPPRDAQMKSPPALSLSGANKPVPFSLVCRVFLFFPTARVLCFFFLAAGAKSARLKKSALRGVLLIGHSKKSCFSRGSLVPFSFPHPLLCFSPRLSLFPFREVCQHILFHSEGAGNAGFGAPPLVLNKHFFSFTPENTPPSSLVPNVTVLRFVVPSFGRTLPRLRIRTKDSLFPLFFPPAPTSKSCFHRIRALRSLFSSRPPFQPLF